MTKRNWKYIAAGLLLSILHSSAVAQGTRINTGESWARDLFTNHDGVGVKLNGPELFEEPKHTHALVYYVPPFRAFAPQLDIDIKAVRDTVLVRFKDAFDANDVKELEKVWRGMRRIDKEEWNKIFMDKEIRNIRINDQCDGNPALKEDFAELACKETIAYTTDDVRHITKKVTFKLHKISEIWYVMERVVK